MSPVTGAEGARSFDGKYRIVERLGGDGPIERYLAEHVAIGRPVEVHCLAPGEAAGGEAALELARTARALGSATHRNLQSVVDSGLDARGRPYVVFEALRGKTLSTLVGRPFETGRAARIVVQILEALRELHDAGVVLRCLSPADVVIEPVSGGAELVKLRGVRGAALAIDGGAEPLGVAGSGAYVAPELRRGELGLDPRVDVFSVGVMLREMLTGSTRGDVGALPELAVRAIARACAEDPDERFASADGFLQAAALLLPTSDRAPCEPIPTPEDPLQADLRYLHLRRTTRYVTRGGAAESRLSLLPVLLTIEAIYRRFGPGTWAELCRRVPEAESLLPGAGHTPVHVERGVPTRLFSEILVAIDRIAGRGDLGLVTELGEAIARRGLFRLFPDLPQPLTPPALVSSWPYVWGRIARDGTARVQRIADDAARVSVERQGTPSLELAGLVAGLLRQALREAGAREPRVQLVGSEALGDKQDLYGIEWR